MLTLPCTSNICNFPSLGEIMPVTAALTLKCIDTVCCHLEVEATDNVRFVSGKLKGPLNFCNSKKGVVITHQYSHTKHCVLIATTTNLGLKLEERMSGNATSPHESVL